MYASNKNTQGVGYGYGGFRDSMIWGFCGDSHRFFCGYGMGIGIKIQSPRQPWAFRCMYVLKRLQLVTNSAARLVFSSSRYEHITPHLRQLHWLKAAERIDYKLALLVCTMQVSARCSTAVPRRRTLPASRHRNSMLSAFRFSIVTDCPPYMAVNRQQSSFSGRRPSYLEQSSTAGHVSTVTWPSFVVASILISSGAAFHDFTILLSCPRSDMSVRTR